MNREFWTKWEKADFDVKMEMIKNNFGVDTTIIHEDRIDEYLQMVNEILSDLLIVKNEVIKYYNTEGIKKLTEQRNKILTGEYYGDQFETQEKDYSGDEYEEDDSQIVDKINNPGTIEDYTP